VKGIFRCPFPFPVSCFYSKKEEIVPYNRELLEAALAWTKEKNSPIRLDMKTWFHGQKACLGGWAIHQAGGLIRGIDIPDASGQIITAYVAELGNVRSEPGDMATRLLGLTDDEANVLFDLNYEEEEDDRSLAFLGELVQRAQEGKPNMSDDEVTIWCAEWERVDLW